MLLIQFIKHKNVEIIVGRYAVDTVADASPIKCTLYIYMYYNDIFKPITYQ